MTIPAAYLDELKSRVSLPALISKRVKLVRNGGEWLGLCPFHNEKTESFNVVPAKGFYHCFGCGAHGNAIDFTMRAEGIDFIAAVQLLAGLAGMKLPDGSSPSAADPSGDPQQQPASELKPRAALAADERIKREEARAIWLAGRSLEPGDPVWRYLAGRAIDLAVLGRVPGALRYHPRCWHTKLRWHFPAMVAAVSDDSAEAGGHLSTHCTFLEEQSDGTVTAIGDHITGGHKRLRRRCYGSYRGGSIKLTRGASGKGWRHAPDGDRAISGEGIEDTLTGALLFPAHRAFAGISGGNYKNISLPSGIREVILLWQNDERKQNAPDWWPRAEAHFRALGRRVGRLRPPVFVKDLNELAQWAARVGEDARLFADDIAEMGEIAA